VKVFLRYLALPLITTCIVAAGVVVFYYLDAPRDTDVTLLPREASTLAEPASTSGTGKAIAASRNPLVSRVDFVYPKDNDARDPFQKISASVNPQQSSEGTEKQTSFILAGVIWSEEDPVAIIIDADNNSYLVRTGEEMGSMKILAIQPRSVTIEMDSKTQELVLWPARL
jgi:hypothetical protein